MWLLSYKESIAPTFFGILKKSLISFTTGPAWFLGRMLINILRFNGFHDVYVFFSKDKMVQWQS